MTNPTTDYTDRTFAFACDIVRFYRDAMRVPHFPFDVARQVLKSGTSIGANIAEAQVPTSRPDFRNKIAIALREAREAKYWLRLIRATNLAPSISTETLLQECDELVAILTASLRTIDG